MVNGDRKAELERLLETLRVVLKHDCSTEELNHSYVDRNQGEGEATELLVVEQQQQQQQYQYGRINRSSSDYILSLAELLDGESAIEFQEGEFEETWLLLSNV